MQIWSNILCRLPWLVRLPRLPLLLHDPADCRIFCSSFVTNATPSDFPHLNRRSIGDLCPKNHPGTQSFLVIDWQRQPNERPKLVVVETYYGTRANKHHCHMDTWMDTCTLSICGQMPYEQEKNGNKNSYELRVTREGSSADRLPIWVKCGVYRSVKSKLAETFMKLSY